MAVRFLGTAWKWSKSTVCARHLLAGGRQNLSVSKSDPHPVQNHDSKECLLNIQLCSLIVKIYRHVADSLQVWFQTTAIKQASQ